MELIHKNIKQLIGKYGLNYDIFLPAIQRPFVWLNNPNEMKIEIFFDSLLKKYPIGSFLLWRIHKEDDQRLGIENFTCEFSYEHPNNSRKKEDFVNDTNFLVLDGQQRLTALYIGLAGSRKIRKRGKAIPQEEELYINLQKLPETGIPDSKYELQFFTKQEIQERHKQGELWYKCKDIIGIEDSYSVNNIYPNDATASKILHILFDLVNREYVFPCYDFKLDDAVEVFSRINKGGEPLEKTDLLMSFIIAKFEDIDIKEKLIDRVKGWQEEGFSQFGMDALLATFMVIITDKTKFKVGDFETDVVKKIENQWENIVDSINNIIKRLKRYGYAYSKISTNIIISLALLNFRKLLKDVEDKDILNFIYRLQLKRFFDSGTTEQLQKIVNAVKIAQNFTDVLQNLKTELEVSDTDIKEIVDEADYTKSSLAFTVLQLLFGQSNAKDKDHIDHIYPKSQFNKKTGKKSKKDKLFNLQILPPEINQTKGKLSPQEWLDMTYKTIEEQENFKCCHFLPQDIPLTWENVEAFEIKRRQILIDELKRKFQIK